jgi:Mg/Co/Ni transporter MgtE
VECHRRFQELKTLIEDHDMEIGEIVEQLMEKQVTEMLGREMAVNVYGERGSSDRLARIESMIRDILSEKMEEKRDEIRAKVLEKFEKCRMEVEFRYGNITVKFVNPEED